MIAAIRLRQIQNKALKIIIYFLLASIVIVINFPFIWMVLSSFKAPKDLYLFPPKLFPSSFLFTNYILAWGSALWPRYFLNSTITALVPALGQMFLGALAAFAFSRKFRGSKVLFTLFLGSIMIPPQATLIANYVIVNTLGWLDTYFALTVPFVASAFGVFLLRQYMLTIPKDLEDAAVIDGCGWFAYLFRIAIPMSMPAMLTVGLFAFRAQWNNFIWPITVTMSDKMRVVQVGLSVFQTEDIMEVSHLMAACTFTSIPIIVLFLIVQKRFIEGITLSGLKL